MSRGKLLVGCGVAVLGMGAAADAALYEVGVGKTYSTIQSAVDAAAAADVATASNNTPNASPVTIRIYGGTYAEQVNVPADPSGAYAGLNDGWSIASAPGETVWIHGGIGVHQGRDNGVIDGIHIKQSAGTGPGYAFAASGNTARAWVVQNGIVYNDGTNTSPGFNGFLMYGSVNLDHMTFYGGQVGVSNGYAAAGAITNTIIVNAAQSAVSANNSYSSSPTAYSYSLLFGNTANSAGPHAVDGGNNVFADPLFASVDPSSPDFLKLTSTSPALNAGTSTGRFQDGAHIGAMGVAAVPEPAALGVLAMTGLGLTARRRRRR
jgi:hypothetical protein